MKQTREQFLAERRKGIGGSDIAALLGVSKWKTRYELWLDKTGRLEDNADAEALERMEWGNILEDVVAKQYAARQGCKVQRINAQMNHSGLPIAVANIDRAVVVPGSVARWTGSEVKGAERVLECKTAHAFAEYGDEWGAPGTDQIPLQYFLQVQWYMGISALPLCDLAVLFGGQKLSVYHIAFDQPLFDDLLNEAGQWWESYVATDTPPPACNANDARSRWIAHIDRKEAIADEALLAHFVDFKGLKASAKALEKQIEEKLDILLPAIGDAEALVHDGEVLATWKKNKDSVSIDWEAAYESLLPLIPADFDKSLDQFKKTKTGARVLRLK